jgi:hypothetical protein
LLLTLLRLILGGDRGIGGIPGRPGCLMAGNRGRTRSDDGRTNYCCCDANFRCSFIY